MKIKIETFELAEPAENEFLIETKVTLISIGTELTALRGDFPDQSAWSTYVKYPFVPGYYSVGEVIKCGSRIKNFSVGDID